MDPARKLVSLFPKRWLDPKRTGCFLEARKPDVSANFIVPALRDGILREICYIPMRA
jgi:hypothetical protein